MTEVSVDQLSLRHVASPAIVLEGGRLYHPVGAFAARCLSVSDPLIGLPDGYPDAGRRSTSAASSTTQSNCGPEASESCGYISGAL